MNILEVYKKYQIMPQLAEHQLRVAAVADSIILNLSSLTINRDEVMAACLLHDMGNIIKFDLSVTKGLINKNLDLAYWQTVKNGYIEKYGRDEHVATVKIIKELGISQRILDMADSVSFLGAAKTAAGEDFGAKIVQYCDDRVAPVGVVSLEQRFADLRARYKNHEKDTIERSVFENALRKIEQQIFEHCKISPEDITEASVSALVQKLESFEI